MSTLRGLKIQNVTPEFENCHPKVDATILI